MKAILGVSRAVLRFDPDDEPDTDLELCVIESHSNAWALITGEPDEIPHPVELVVYTLDADRLRALLAAAAAGADIDALIFDLDAAALASEEPDPPFLDDDDQAPPG